MKSTRLPFRLTNAALQLIAQLERAPLLTQLGSPFSDRRVIRASSWREGLKRAMSKRWYNARISWNNVLTEQLSLSFREDYQRWNMIADACRPMFDPIVAKALDQLDGHFPMKESAKKQLFYSIRVDLIGCVHEIEYDRLVKLTYHRSLLTWYLEGHMPCDCEGDPREGRLVVF